MGAEVADLLAGSPVTDRLAGPLHFGEGEDSCAGSCVLQRGVNP